MSLKPDMMKKFGILIQLITAVMDEVNSDLMLFAFGFKNANLG